MNLRDLLQGWTEAVEQATASIEQQENVDLENVAGLTLASKIQAGGKGESTAGTYCGYCSMGPKC